MTRAEALLTIMNGLNKLAVEAGASIQDAYGARFQQYGPPKSFAQRQQEMRDNALRRSGMPTSSQQAVTEAQANEAAKARMGIRSDAELQAELDAQNQAREARPAAERLAAANAWRAKQRLPPIAATNVSVNPDGTLASSVDAPGSRRMVAAAPAPAAPSPQAQPNPAATVATTPAATTPAVAATPPPAAPATSAPTAAPAYGGWASRPVNPQANSYNSGRSTVQATPGQLPGQRQAMLAQGAQRLMPRENDTLWQNFTFQTPARKPWTPPVRRGTVIGPRPTFHIPKGLSSQPYEALVQRGFGSPLGARVSPLAAAAQPSPYTTKPTGSGLLASTQAVINSRFPYAKGT